MWPFNLSSCCWQPWLLWQHTCYLPSLFLFFICPSSKHGRVWSKSSKKHPRALGDCRAKKKSTSSLAVNKECSKIFQEHRKKGTEKRDEIWPSFFKWISRLQLERKGMFVFKTIKYHQHTSFHIYHPYQHSSHNALLLRMKTRSFCFFNEKTKHQCK